MICHIFAIRQIRVFMEDTAIPYELPEAENHSFFFIDQ